MRKQNNNSLLYGVLIGVSVFTLIMFKEVKEKFFTKDKKDTETTESTKNDNSDKITKNLQARV